MSEMGQLPNHTALEQAQQVLANALLFRELDPSIESLRMKRARAVEAFIRSILQSQEKKVEGAGVGAGVLSDSQRQRIDMWLVQERAESIQQILKSALRN